MAIRSKRYVCDYQREGETLVAICKGCRRTSILNFGEINRRAKHMLTLEELARILRCRNCRKKVAEVRLQRSFTRRDATRH